MSRVLLLCFFWLPLLSLADANQGEMGGYQLGQRYAMDAATQWQAENDKSVKIATQQAIKPDGVDKVYVYASPGSHTIGKIIYQNEYPDLDSAAAAAEGYRGQLQAEYPDWDRLKAPIPMGKAGGAIVSRMQSGAYALIVYYKAVDDAAQLVVELEYGASSPQKKAWRQQLREEATSAAPTAG